MAFAAKKQTPFENTPLTLTDKIRVTAEKVRTLDGEIKQ
jgi:hypothetical protein